jgi:SanA protein
MSPKVRRILFRTALAGVVSLMLVCAAAYLAVRSAGKGKCFDKPEAVPVRRVAMVLGCPKFLPNKHPSLEYARRVSAAAELFKAGRCERVLVSSDVDAPAMLADVCDAGVPYGKLDCDSKGVRTRDSVVRAKKVFGITSGIVVSQRYHNERSIYIGEEIGADWVGYNAQDAVGLPKWRSRGRETLARVKAWLDRHVLDRK